MRPPSQEYGLEGELTGHSRVHARVVRKPEQRQPEPQT